MLGLLDYSFEEAVSWPFGEVIFNIEYDIMSDTIKSRRYGFLEWVDTEEMLFRLFTEFQKSALSRPCKRGFEGIQPPTKIALPAPRFWFCAGAARNSVVIDRIYRTTRKGGEQYLTSRKEGHGRFTRHCLRS
jgi:hypothetical protein